MDHVLRCRICGGTGKIRNSEFLDCQMRQQLGIKDARGCFDLCSNFVDCGVPENGDGEFIGCPQCLGDAVFKFDYVCWDYFLQGAEMVTEVLEVEER